MTRRPLRYWLLPALFWFGALIGAWVLAASPRIPPGWDLHVYANAVHALRMGHDPYADGIAVQQAYHLQPLAHPDPDAMPPYTYVYAPITLPLVRLLAALPGRLAHQLYWLLFSLAICATALVGVQLAETWESRGFALFAPAAVFFPGLLRDDAYMSGNVVYILYALLLAAALLGWRRGRWVPFYVAVVVASCFKAPLLSLVLIAPLSARRQWLPAGITSAVGLAAFALQPLFWPGLFHHYLQAVQLQFDYNRDFGLSPAGLFGYALTGAHLPYSPWASIAYLVYAIPLFGLLVYLSRRFVAGDFSMQQWVPVLLLGVFLLNPRIKEYDVAPLTVPMALIAWRLLARDLRPARALFEAALFLLAMNALARAGVNWKPLEAVLMVSTFGGGVWALLRPSVAQKDVRQEQQNELLRRLSASLRPAVGVRKQLRTD